MLTFDDARGRVLEILDKEIYGVPRITSFEQIVVETLLSPDVVFHTLMIMIQRREVHVFDAMPLGEIVVRLRLFVDNFEDAYR